MAGARQKSARCGMGASNAGQCAQQCAWTAYATTRKTIVLWAREHEAKGRASVRHSSTRAGVTWARDRAGMSVVLSSAQVNCEIWLSGEPECTPTCSDVRQEHGGWIMRKLEALCANCERTVPAGRGSWLAEIL